MKPHGGGVGFEPPTMGSVIRWALGTLWQAGLTTADQPRRPGEPPFTPWFQLLRFGVPRRVFDYVSIWFSSFAQWEGWSVTSLLAGHGAQETLHF